MRVIQIVGYKNSGKTTLVQSLVKLFLKKGIRVASLKHHGHGGIPLGIEEADSEKHRQAGALISGVEGNHLLQLSNQQTWKMEHMIAIYELLNIELLLIEGFKQYHYDKIVLIRKEADLHLLDRITNIQAAITPLQLQQSSYQFPVFKQNDSEAFNQWVCSYMNS